MPKKLTYEYVKEFINKENLLISTEYINNKELLEIECKICNEIYNQTFDRYNTGYRHQKCSNIENNKKSVYKRSSNIVIKTCIQCSNQFKPKRKEQKICNRECYKNFMKTNEEYKQKCIISGRNGGIKSLTILNRRGKNEISFADLCIEYFGKDKVLCNELFLKIKIIIFGMQISYYHI